MKISLLTHIIINSIPLQSCASHPQKPNDCFPSPKFQIYHFHSEKKKKNLKYNNYYNYNNYNYIYQQFCSSHFSSPSSFSFRDFFLFLLHNLLFFFFLLDQMERICLNFRWGGRGDVGNVMFIYCLMINW